MRVVVISSSPNEIGLTNSCVEVCLKTLEQENIETEWIVLNKYNIKKCEACGKRGWGMCLEEHSCRLDDDFNLLKEKIADFDAMIIVSPVYFYEMSESAKTFFDRLKRCVSFDENWKMKGKSMLCIACAGGSGDGTDNTLNSMKILAKFLHMEVVKYIGVTRMNFEQMKNEMVEGTNELILRGEIMNQLEKLVDIHFNGQIKIGSSQKIERQEYDIQYSKMIHDYYWNYAFLKSEDVDLKNVWPKIKKDMEKLNRQPVLYLMSNVELKKIERQLIDSQLENIYTDVWMAFCNPENFEDCESQMNVEISCVKSSEKNEFIGAIMNGFSSSDPNDPYGTLPEEYRSIYKLEFIDEAFHKLEYCGKYKGEMIATANVWYKGDSAIIYSVSTKKEFQKKGVCKKLMSYMMKDLSNLGIKTVCVQTEKGFYTEKVYEKMGFREVMLGRVYGEKEE